MKIKTKLFALGGMAVVGLLAMAAVSQRITDNVDQINQAELLVSKLEVRLLNLRRNEKDFLLRQDSKYVAKFEQNLATFKQLDADLADLLQRYDIRLSTQLAPAINEYQQQFLALNKAYIEQGYLGDDGLIDQLDAQAQQLTASLDAEQQLRLTLLLDEVQLGHFPSWLNGDEQLQRLATLAQAVVSQQQRIGTDYKSGLLGQVRASSHQVEQQFDDYASAIDAAQQQVVGKLMWYKHLAIALVVMLLMVLVIAISRSINGKLNRLSQVIREISTSNNVGIRAKLAGQDELTDLVSYFNQLLEKIETLVVGSQIKSKQLSSNTVAMEQQLQQVLQQFAEQAQHTDGMATAVQQMVSTIEEITQSSNISLEGVRKAADNAGNGRQVVDSTVSEINQLSHTLESSRQSVASLSQQVDKIGGAVEIIREVAEQTNLLALNAAIEAARAGEQGRGFAVVADEVRSLASRTHQSTEDIAQMVTAINRQMQQAEADMQRCNQQGAQTLQHSQSLDGTLQQIIDDMHNIQQNSEQIAAAIMEQSVVMKQVGESVVELSTISERNSDGAQQCLQEVSLVAGQAQEMDRVVAEFKTG